MRIEIIVGRKRLVLGQVLDLPEKEARGLIEKGLAKAVDAKQTKKTEGKTNAKEKEKGKDKGK